MKIFQNKVIKKIYNDILNDKVHKSFNENINPKKNIKNKILYLPIIKSNSYFYEKSPINIHKGYLEGFKPKEDKKIRHKIDSSGNNKGLNIKNLSFEQNQRDDDDILLLVNKVKIFNSNKKNIINDNFFNNDLSIKRNLIILNKYYNSLNKTEINENPHKIKKILINEPNLSFDGININNHYTNIKDKIHEFNFSPYCKKNNDKKKEKNDNKSVIHNIFFKWIDEINFNNFTKINFGLIKKKINGLNLSYDSSSNSLNGIEKLHHIDNQIIKSAYLSKNNYNRNKIKFNNEKIIDIFNTNKELNKSFEKIGITNKDNNDIKNLKSENSENISIRESSQFKSNSFIEIIAEDNDENTNINKEEKISKKIISNLSKKDKKTELKENNIYNQIQNFENENKIKIHKISEKTNDKLIKNFGLMENNNNNININNNIIINNINNINNNNKALLSNYENINFEKKRIKGPINLFRKSINIKNDNQKMKNIDNNDNDFHIVKSMNSIHNLNKKASNKDFENIVLNNSSSENKANKIKIENPYQNNNLSTINSIHDDSTINNDI